MLSFSLNLLSAGNAGDPRNSILTHPSFSASPSAIPPDIKATGKPRFSVQKSRRLSPGPHHICDSLSRNLGWRLLWEAHVCRLGFSGQESLCVSAAGEAQLLRRQRLSASPERNVSVSRRLRCLTSLRISASPALWEWWVT